MRRSRRADATPTAVGNYAAAADDADISTGEAPVRTLVVRAREDLEIARAVRAALS